VQPLAAGALSFEPCAHYLEQVRQLFLLGSQKLRRGCKAVQKLVVSDSAHASSDGAHTCDVPELPFLPALPFPFVFPKLEILIRSLSFLQPAVDDDQRRQSRKGAQAAARSALLCDARKAHRFVLCRSSQQALTAPLGDTKVAMSAFEPDSFINYQVGSVSNKAENGFRRHTAAY
jgi:hypothetical protein